MSVKEYPVYASRCFGRFLCFLDGLGPSVFFLFLGPAAATRWLVPEVRPAVLSGGTSTMFSAEAEAKGKVNCSGVGSSTSRISQSESAPSG